MNPTDSSEAATYYSNFVQVNISPHKFELYVSRYSMPIVLQPSSEPTSVEVKPRPVASIAIPLRLVRALIKARETSVQHWETNFGEPLATEPTSGSAENATEAEGQGVGAQAMTVYALPLAVGMFEKKSERALVAQTTSAGHWPQPCR